MPELDITQINFKVHDSKIIECDMKCPELPDHGKPNFWQSSCYQKIGNYDIRSCYEGCKEAAKYPKLKQKMDAVIAEHKEKEIQQRSQIEAEKMLAEYKRRCSNKTNRTRLNQKQRAVVVQMFKERYSIADTVDAVKCCRSTVINFRKIYRQGKMDINGILAA